jgi:hypothetical protein
MKGNICFFFISLACFCSCKTSKGVFNPDKKFAPEKLREDYQLFRHILEESHPSLYWYTTKDSLDYYFDHGYAQIRDSMTEAKFKALLTYVITRIDCGHTAIKYSKQYSKYLDTAKLKSFPLILKFWSDTMLVTSNLNRNDSIFKRGTIIKSINGWSQPQLRDTFFNYIITDGHSLSGKYQSLSTGFVFSSLYKNTFGMPEKFDINYLDSLGEEKRISIPAYDFKADTIHRLGIEPNRISKKKKKNRPQWVFFTARSLRMDTASSTAFMALNTFDRGNHLKHFFHRSFRKLDKHHIRNLIIDVRSNGGGDAGNSALLTRYIIDKKFKLADSLYALNRSSRYDKYVGKSGFYHFAMLFITSKKDDGKYHYGYFERHYFRPKKKHHFNGDVYILTGGNSFSATTLFAGQLKGQKNVTLVGEETGGGYYGNTGGIIPDVTLPNTKLRFRLPRFRLVVDKNREKNGRGIMPDVWALPSSDAIRKGIDFKTAKARELIENRIGQNK